MRKKKDKHPASITYGAYAVHQYADHVVVCRGTVPVLHSSIRKPLTAEQMRDRARLVEEIHVRAR